MSHFPTADSCDLAQTSAHIERMERFCAELGLPDDVVVHTHKSAATVRLGEPCDALLHQVAWRV